MNEKTIIIYHRVDYDGVGSMLTANYYLKNCIPESEVEILGWNYGDELPNLDDIISNFNNVIMVDISFPYQEMLKLSKARAYGKIKLVWIDHHITAINDSIKWGYNDIPGIRDEHFAAIENTWCHFFPNNEVPPIIQLLGTYDVWNLNRFDWFGMVLPLQFALKAKYSLSVEKLGADWDSLLCSSFQNLMPIIESGKLILEYLKGVWNSAMKVYSFEVTVAGKYKGICCLSTEFSSNIFGAKSKEYDVMVVVNYRPANNYFNVSMYVDPDRFGDFSAGEYLKENYGGGGHKGAAGGHITLEQFNRLITQKII